MEKVTKPLCIILVPALIVTSPGLASYQAMAAVVAPTPLSIPSIGAGAGIAGASLAASRTAASSGLHGLLPRTGASLPGMEAVTASLPGTSAAIPLHDGTPTAALGAPEAQLRAVAARAMSPSKGEGLVQKMRSLLSPASSAPAKKNSPMPDPKPWSPVRAAEEWRIFFDGTRRRKDSSADTVQGAYSIKSSGMRFGMAGPAAEDVVLSEIPSPGPEVQSRSLFDNPMVKAALPAGILAAGALLLNAELLPIAVASGGLMLSILFHETAHILGLRVFGDDAPARAGRDSLNPLRSADALGSLLVPAASLALSHSLTGTPLMAGWAKPVPVEFNNLANVRKDAAKVALMGPAANVAIAGLAAAALYALPALGLISAAGTGGFVLSTLVKMNLALAVFHLIPLPWNDGGKLLLAVLPQNLYDRWVHNPDIPPAYQSLYQKLYEGPSFALSMLNFRTTSQINGFTRAASLAALAGFVYFLSTTPASLPLLLLALPCSYDYWCIREKVRSEKAVEDMMDLMSQWGGLLVQIAEDHDAESEVSAFEAEHAMKNAVDQLLEDLMMKEDFRKLSDEDKIKEFMRLYPDMAVKFLKEKVLTEDSEDKIREILADERNKPFMKRLEKWLDEHKVFEKMASPHAKKKYMDESREKDQERARGSREDS